MTDQLRVSNTILSWTSTKLLMNGAPFEGVVSIDYEQTRERKKVWGARRNGRALGWTSGKHEVKGLNVRMLVDSFDVLTTLLTPIGLGSYGDAEFPILLQAEEPVIPLPGSTPVLSVLFSPCAIVGEKEARQEGIDELLVDVAIDCLFLTKNGKSLASIVRSLP